AGLDAVDVHHRHDTAHHHRELNETALVEQYARKRRVGRTEGDGLGLDLFDARAGADRLVVQPDAGLFFVGIGPFRIDRIGEGGAGARDVEGGGGHSCGRRDEPGCREGAEKFQGFLSRLFETILFEFFSRRVTGINICECGEADANPSSRRANELAAKRPSATRSSPATKTMGIVVVTALATNALVIGPAIAATCRRTNSVASANSRSI